MAHGLRSEWPPKGLHHSSVEVNATIDPGKDMNQKIQEIGRNLECLFCIPVSYVIPLIDLGRERGSVRIPENNLVISFLP